MIYIGMLSIYTAKSGQSRKTSDKYFPRTVAKLTYITVLNRVFNFFDGNLPKHEDYFDQESIVIQEPERMLNEIEDSTSSMKNPMEKLKTALTILENICKQALPEVERFPIHFYEDGISALDGRLVLRETVALQHWKGNKDYSSYDLIQETIPKMALIDEKSDAQRRGDT